MEKSFGLNFFLKKSKIVDQNELTVYMRITVDGASNEISTKRKCSPDKWDTKNNRMDGRSDAVKEFNNYLDVLERKVFEVKKKLIEFDLPLTALNIKHHLTGRNKAKTKRMLLEIFKYHNEQVDALVNHTYSKNTLKKYNTIYKHTQTFLKERYKISDIDICELNYEFIGEFQFWLKKTKQCNHNSAIKYLTNFRKIIFLCLKNGWLARDPFIGFSMAKNEVERIGLSQHELDKLTNKEFDIDRLGNVKDIFLFCCYSGLAYVDVQKLKHSDIIIGIDGLEWICIERQKTNVRSRVPLLPFALNILAKYKSHPQCLLEDRILPVLSNQKMNAYLKEIADISGINKNLTFHIARHTFATTVTLSNGVPIETVSKMLGHKNLRTTQHYAKILDHKISEDMAKIRVKF